MALNSCVAFGCISWSSLGCGLQHQYEAKNRARSRVRERAAAVKRGAEQMAVAARPPGVRSTAASSKVKKATFARAVDVWHRSSSSRARRRSAKPCNCAFRQWPCCAGKVDGFGQLATVDIVALAKGMSCRLVLLLFPEVPSLQRSFDCCVYDLAHAGLTASILRPLFRHVTSAVRSEASLQ